MISNTGFMIFAISITIGLITLAVENHIIRLRINNLEERIYK